MNEPALNLEVLGDIVVLSNTPTYLFGKFREDASVQALARALPAVELARRAHDSGSRFDRSFADKVQAYACLAALSHKPRREIIAAFDAHLPPRMDWALEMREMVLGSAPAETFMERQLSRSARVESALRGSATTSQTSSEMRPNVIIISGRPSVVGATNKEIQSD